MFQQVMLNDPINYWFSSYSVPDGNLQFYTEGYTRPLATDSSGNSYFISYYQDQNSGYRHGFLQKADKFGKLVWSRMFGSGSTQIEPTSVLVDTSNVYVIGNKYPSMFLAKFDLNGTSVLEQTYTMPGGTFCQARAMAFGPSGNTLYLTYYFYTGAAGRSGLMILNASTGAVNAYNNFLTDSTNLNNLAVDEFGNAYIVGTSSTNQGVLLKFNGSAVYQWGVGASNLKFNTIAYTGTYLAVGGNDSSTNNAYWVLFNKTDGSVVWQRNYANDNTTPTSIFDMYFDNGSIYAAGWSRSPTGGSGGLVVKISQVNGFVDTSIFPPTVFYDEAGGSNGLFYGLAVNSTFNYGLNSRGTVTMLYTNRDINYNICVYLVQTSVEPYASISSTVKYPLNTENFYLNNSIAYTVSVASKSYSSGLTYTFDQPTVNTATPSALTSTVNYSQLNTPLIFNPYL